ncbi:MAG: DUF2845 domain-containing protein [Gammaproteobacteria bacterium]|nr:DUF2845 domain-containing protein [Gammaproteobacteria bacterium]MCP4831775.1 DUF2845 domain-containing protein [Gammaproteobacteria bacterium]
MITIAGLVATSLLTPASAWAMRCGSHLIIKGDPKAKVLHYCGEPVDKSEHYALRPSSYPNRGSGIHLNNNGVITDNRYYSYGHTEVKAEEWTYNFGPNKLMQLVRFANDIVEEVKTLAYGYREDKN